MTVLVRAADPSDFAALGRILWEAFGGKLGFFVRVSNDESGAHLMRDLLAAGAIRQNALRVAAAAVAPFENAQTPLSPPLGMCLLRLPDTPAFRAAPAFAVARERLGFWPGLRAFAGFALCDQACRPDTAVISLLAVAPHVRGQGVGGALLCGAENEARKRGLRVLVLDVIENNPARRLYERHGFRVTRTHRLSDPVARVLGYRAYDHMEKTLT